MQQENQFFSQTPSILQPVSFSKVAFFNCRYLHLAAQKYLYCWMASSLKNLGSKK